MTQAEFCNLTDAAQIDLLYKEGVYIDKRKVRKVPVLLFQLESFYVEVCYYKYRLLVSWIRCSSSVQILDPYLDKMDIAELDLNGVR